MASAFNVPDEFVNGFLKSGQDLVQAFNGTGNAPPSGNGISSAQSLAKVQAHYWEQQMALWMGMVASAGGLGIVSDPVVTPERGDRRFQGAGWQDNSWYSLLQQTYLLNSRLLGDMVESADLDGR